MSIQTIISQYNDKNTLYKNNLTNHLNMGLFALYKMGAEEKALHQYAHSYITANELQPLGKVKYRINKKNFFDYVGKEGSYSSFIPFFYRHVNGFGVEESLHEFVDILIKGSPGGAFHGLIRLAYAVELGDRDEIVKALSYMAEAYVEFRGSESLRLTDNPKARILYFYENEGLKAMTFNRPLIIGRMKDVYDNPLFHEMVTALDPSLRTLEALTDLIVKLYGMTEDFTILHGVTSTHALWVLKDYIKNMSQTVNNHWYNLQIAYASTRCTDLKALPKKEEVESFEDIFKEAILKEDVHTIKLVYSLSELSRMMEDDGLYRLLAKRKVKESH